MPDNDEIVTEFTLEDFKLNPLSSLNAPPEEKISAERESDYAAAKSDDAEAAPIEETAETNEPQDPIFKALSAPILPELKRENRARLQMQSPNRIHFYWSFKQNPFQILSRIFGNQTNYQLIARLINRRNEREQIFPIETEGAAWFDVDADASYQVEVGFYAVNRPFVRVMFSNQIETPRKNPSWRQDYSEYFAVSAAEFAQVLDDSGFTQDAFEVALAGDDVASADDATHNAFAQITGETAADFDENFAGELRFVLLALASGYALEDLRGHLNPSIFAFLQKYAADFDAERAAAALRENFAEFSAEEFEDEIFEESIGAATFGASLVNFPRFATRRRKPKFSTDLSSKLPNLFSSKIAPFSSLDLRLK